ncbi:Uma2 family endonuclease [Thermostichus vulcanus]|uniref:Uma2 family endonuclease n=1 Tax=Thermostichus vulcanus str. 'Rupite' TaxID=2813851 RepID=A0ABT0CG81_THEVL|nr:Uma2 family endonuclease [Thermostichus vulcanus]MCJ2544435.1 Uma2 family endonuclease [Thermostichus vulcanus str. 'Rupite']
MIAHPYPKISPHEYLAQERQAEIKSEYIDGDVVAMTGASRQHNLISLNIAASLHSQLRSRPCEIYMGDMRVAVDEAEFYTYPDIVVVCEDPQFLDGELDTLLNPTLLIEVLSPSTASYDRGEKFSRYRQLSSLQEYLVVAQSTPAIEHYRKQSRREWILVDITDPEALIELPSIQCQLAMKDIYEKVNFDSE